MTSAHASVRWLPAIGIVLASVVAGFLLLGPDGGPDPLVIESSAETFDSLDGLMAASDLVVAGTVVDIDEGRTITSPDDPDAGIRTRLVRVRVSTALLGEASGEVVVEEAASFPDGTPIVLDGMTRQAEGDAAIWFLVAGGSETMPYFAAVNGQSRFAVQGDALEASGSDPLSRDLADLGREGLVEAVGAGR